MSVASQLAEKSAKSAQLLREKQMRRFVDMLIAEATKMAETTSNRELARSIGRTDSQYRRELQQMLVEDGFAVSLYFNCGGSCDYGCHCSETDYTEWFVRIHW